jgi:hypothetical protein
MRRLLLLRKLYVNTVLLLTRAEKQYQRERCLFSEEQIQNVRICGTAIFRAHVKAALSELRERYGYGYSLVQRYVRAVIQSDKPPQIGALIGVVYQRVSANEKLPVSQKRFAAYLVRAAVALRGSRSYFLFRSPRSALLVLRRELEAMRILQCEPEYFYRISTEILKREKELRCEEHNRAKATFSVA